MECRRLLAVTRRASTPPRGGDPSTAAARTATSHPLLVGALGALLAVLAALLALPAAAGAQEEEKSVLLYTGTTGYRHSDAINEGRPAVQEALEDAGFEVTWEDCNGFGTAEGQCQNPDKNPRIFTEENLAQYDAIFLFNSSDYWSGTGGEPGQLFTPEQEDAIISFVQNGGGIGANPNATDAAAGQVSWDWWDGGPNSVVGTTMRGHAATDLNNRADVQVADRNHPSTKDLPDTYAFGDEHYNFNRSVRGTHHVLATLDERTYNPGGNAMGADHPISWCKTYDGDNVDDGTGEPKEYDDGRAWVTGMGHFGQSYTENGGDNELVKHIVGGIRWLAGEGKKSDCGGTVWSNFKRTVLVDDANGPIGLDVAADGKVYWTEIGPNQGFESEGHIKMHDPSGPPNNSTVVATIPTRADHGNSEDGVLGMALEPGFDLSDPSKRDIYVYYSPRNPDWPTSGDEIEVGYNQISRFTLNEDGTAVVPDSERVILRVPKAKISGSPGGCEGCPPDSGPGHVGGAGLAFDSEGNLYLGVGDDVSPNAGGHGGYPPLDYRAQERRDARKTSANTADLRGKIIRITPIDEIPAGTEPGLGDTYTVPEGNMFEPGTANTRPEIYAMGFRQPFTVQTDPANPGVVTVGEYCHDNSANGADRAPAGTCEWNLVDKPGFHGWPYCMGDNSPANSSYRWDYQNNASTGEIYDCSQEQIPADLHWAPEGQSNPGPTFEGLENIPGPAIPATIWKKYPGASGGPDPLDFGDLSAGGMQPITGPIYRFNPDTAGEGAFPAYYDGSWLIHNRGADNGFWKEARLRSDNNQLLRVNDWLPADQFGSPNTSLVIPSRFGPDGALYMARFPVTCCRNQLNESSQAQIIKIEFGVVDECLTDENPPSVDHSIEGQQHPDEEDTYINSATLSLSANDVGCAGVETIEYRINSDADEWEEYTEPIPFDEPGTYEVDYRATDEMGNVSAVFTATFTVVAIEDTTPPTVTAELAGDQDTRGFYVGAAELTVTAEDDPTGSGVATIEYRANGGEWTEYTDVVTFDDPEPYVVEVRATDEAGNTSEPEAVEFRVVSRRGCVAELEEEFSDEFDGDTLKPIWERHTRNGGTPTSGPMAPTLSDGQLIMPTHDFELDASSPDTSVGPVNFIGQDLNALGDDWQVETQFTIEHTGGWQHAGLIVWNGDNNLFRSTITNSLNGVDGERGIYVESSKDNPTTAEGARVQAGGNVTVLRGEPVEPVTIRMRYTREDGSNSVIGEYMILSPERAATDGWEEFPATNGAWINSGGLDLNPAGGPRRDAPGSRIGLIAAGNFPGTSGLFEYQGDPAEMIVDYFRVTGDTITCEQNAPTTDATLDPATPGPGGTYDGPVKVNLSASDSGDPEASGVERTEYRLTTNGAAGEWTAVENGDGDDPFTTSLTVSNVGSHVVEFRSSDNAGNDEETRSVAFTIAEGSPPGPGPSEPPPADAPPPPAPRAELGSLPTKLSAAKLRKGFEVTGRCEGADDGTVALKVDKKNARKLGLRKATTIAKARVSCENGGFSVKLKPKRKVKRALKRLRGTVKATLELTVNGSGATAKETDRVRIKGKRGKR